MSGHVSLLGRRGLGITAAVDRTFAGDGFNPSTFSFGIQYHFGSRGR